jgi:SAM-dependent methyltransferase
MEPEIGRAPSAPQMNLHLGCYNRPTVGWYNTDISMQIRLARVPFGPRTAHKLGLISGSQLADHSAGIWKSIKRLDVSKRFPFADQSVDAVFSSHVFEHLVNPVARNMLRECARILKPTGVFRIVIPDLDQVIAEYDSSQPDVTMKRIFETQQRSKDRHWWMYNTNSLEQMLLSNGFQETVQCKYLYGTCPDLDLVDNRPEESIYIEAFV